jgi:hypothetical protein
MQNRVTLIIKLKFNVIFHNSSKIVFFITGNYIQNNINSLDISLTVMFSICLSESNYAFPLSLSTGYGKKCFNAKLGLYTKII